MLFCVDCQGDIVYCLWVLCRDKDRSGVWRAEQSVIREQMQELVATCSLWLERFCCYSSIHLLQFWIWYNFLVFMVNFDIFYKVIRSLQ